jgi:regulator of sigma E protease
MFQIVSFLFILGLLVFIHELGHFVVAKLAGVKVEEFGFGFPPRLVAVRRGETEYSLNLIPLGGFVRMLGEEDPTAPRSFARAPKRWRSLILIAGPGMNLVLAALLFAGGYVAGWPTATETKVQVRSVLPASPAERAGLQPGDYILSLGGRAIDDTNVLREQTQNVLGRETPMLVERGGQQVEIVIQPNSTWSQDRGALGVTIANQPTKIEPVPYPIHEALVQGAQRVGDTVGFTVGVPAMIVRGLIPAEAARPVGPVGIFQVTGQAAEESATSGWWFPLLYTAAALSVGLGVANLLPIPGLDGGRLVFVLVEAVRGRRISPQRESLIHMVGIAFLLTLVLVISYYDLTAPLPEIDWGMR